LSLRGLNDCCLESFLVRGHLQDLATTKPKKTTTNYFLRIIQPIVNGKKNRSNKQSLAYLAPTTLSGMRKIYAQRIFGK